MDELEQQLRARLRQPPVEVPGEVDAAILLEARRRLPPPPLRRRWPWIATTTAAAAAAILVFVLWPPDEAPQPRPFDVVDAYRLAAQLRTRTAVEPRWDVNRDGRVDAGDVERILELAVTLEPGRRS